MRSYSRKRTIRAWATTAALALAILGATAYSTPAAPGDLDPTFGGGIVVTDIDETDRARALVVQPDGRLVVVGDTSASSGPARFVVARYADDGNLDPAFGTGGVATQAVAGRAHAVALLADGKILVGGSAPAIGTDLALARFDTSGILDPTFGHGGLTTTDVDFHDTILAIAPQADGRIVVAGGARDGYPIPTGTFVVARYLSDGGLDPSFGDDGIVRTQVQPGILMNAEAYAVTVLPDGRVLIVGSSQTDIVGSETIALVRHHADGSLDTSFGNGGIILSPTDARAFGAAVQPDGRIVAVGVVGGFGPFGSLVARYTPSGHPDVTFGGIGVVTGDTTSARAVAVQSDDALVVGGRDESGFALLRYAPDGSLDQTFGVDGVVNVGAGSSGVTDLALDTVGRIVSVGYGGGDLLLTRHLASNEPIPDPTLLPSPIRTPGPLGPRRACQRTLTKESAKLLKSTLRTVAKCERAKRDGHYTGPCPDPAAAPGSAGARAATRVARAEAKFHDKVAARCGGQDGVCATADDPFDMQVDLELSDVCPDVAGGGCAASVDDCGALSACVGCVIAATVDRSMTLAYGELAPGPDRELARCQSTVAQETQKLLLAREHATSRCWNHALQGSDIGGTMCPDGDGVPGRPARAAAEKIARATARAAARVCNKCGGKDRRCDADVDTALITPGGRHLTGTASGDDLTPAAIGSLDACPALTLPVAPHTDCSTLDDLDGAPDAVDSLRELVLCSACVTTYRVDCLDRTRQPAVGVPASCLP